MVDTDEIQFVKLPPLWKKSPVVKRLYEGSRWYVERGSVVSFRQWQRELRRAYKGDLIPFTWVAEFVGVSRSAVHQRARAGGLTVFSFIITERSRTFLGGARERDTRRRYDYATISECEAWQYLLMEWADEQEAKRKREEKQ